MLRKAYMGKIWFDRMQVKLKSDLGFLQPSKNRSGFCTTAKNLRGLLHNCEIFARTFTQLVKFGFGDLHIMGDCSQKSRNSMLRFMILLSVIGPKPPNSADLCAVTKVFAFERCMWVLP